MATNTGGGNLVELAVGEKTTLENKAKFQLGGLRQAMMGSPSTDPEWLAESIRKLASGVGYVYLGMLLQAVSPQFANANLSIPKGMAELTQGLFNAEEIKNLAGYITRDRDLIKTFAAGDDPDSETVMNLAQYRAAVLERAYQAILETQAAQVFTKPNERIIPSNIRMVTAPAAPTATAMPAATTEEVDEQPAAEQESMESEEAASAAAGASSSTTQPPTTSLTEEMTLE